jgi:hypothetical protein
MHSRTALSLAPLSCLAFADWTKQSSVPKAKATVIGFLDFEFALSFPAFLRGDHRPSMPS